MGMRMFDRATAEAQSVSGVTVVRWEQYELAGTVPFQAMWYEVPPGAAAPLDRHPERELSVVVAGTAEVEAGGDTVRVPSGSAFLLDGGEAHRVRNASATSPLVVFSAYWMPAEQTVGSRAAAVGSAGGGGEGPDV